MTTTQITHLKNDELNDNTLADMEQEPLETSSLNKSTEVSMNEDVSCIIDLNLTERERSDQTVECDTSMVPSTFQNLNVIPVDDRLLRKSSNDKIIILDVQYFKPGLVKSGLNKNLNHEKSFDHNSSELDNASDTLNVEDNNSTIEHGLDESRDLQSQNKTFDMAVINISSDVSMKGNSIVLEDSEDLLPQPDQNSFYSFKPKLKLNDKTFDKVINISSDLEEISLNNTNEQAILETGSPVVIEPAVNGAEIFKAFQVAAPKQCMDSNVTVEHKINTTVTGQEIQATTEYAACEDFDEANYMNFILDACREMVESEINNSVSLQECSTKLVCSKELQTDNIDNNNEMASERCMDSNLSAEDIMVGVQQTIDKILETVQNKLLEEDTNSEQQPAYEHADTTNVDSVKESEVKDSREMQMPNYSQSAMQKTMSMVADSASYSPSTLLIPFANLKINSTSDETFVSCESGDSLIVETNSDNDTLDISTDTEFGFEETSCLNIEPNLDYLIGEVTNVENTVDASLAEGTERGTPSPIDALTVREMMPAPAPALAPKFEEQNALDNQGSNDVVTPNSQPGPGENNSEHDSDMDISPNTCEGTIIIETPVHSPVNEPPMSPTNPANADNSNSPNIEGRLSCIGAGAIDAQNTLNNDDLISNEQNIVNKTGAIPKSRQSTGIILSAMPAFSTPSPIRQQVNRLGEQLYNEALRASPSVFDAKCLEYQVYLNLKFEKNYLQQEIARLTLELKKKEGQMMALYPHKVRLLPHARCGLTSEESESEGLQPVVNKEKDELLECIQKTNEELGNLREKLSDVKKEYEIVKEENEKIKKENVNLKKSLNSADAVLSEHLLNFEKAFQEEKAKRAVTTDEFDQLVQKYQLQSEMLLEVKMVYHRDMEKMETENKELRQAYELFRSSALKQIAEANKENLRIKSETEKACPKSAPKKGLFRKN